MVRAALLALSLLAGCAQAREATPPPADLVLVDKSDRTLTLFTEGRVTMTVSGIQLGDAPEGHKQFEGDERTPEGLYAVDYRNPDSAYHLSLHISYPNASDRAFAQSRGRSPGGAIFIHGQPNGLPGADRGVRVPGDWTDGCIAVSNAAIELLWQVIPDGTPIEIRP
ncbi:L,D-transpeptidase family protein [Tsuneonella sp. SYSU-LHT278]|uniref:L,D-transpeptidase family protein n=1 Tax=Tsuneonella sediminis TaxID=3416089 RepID=UPI003F795E01